MRGKLFGVGIGPGDPELLTLKAIRILTEVDVVAVPKSALEKESQALHIVKDALVPGKEILELIFPMSRDERILSEGWKTALYQIQSRLDQGLRVAFITLGDPTIYSTYMYVHKALKPLGYDMEIIPGITSFCASAASVGISLGENRENIAIIPSAYECENIEEIIRSFDTVVLMKVSNCIPGLKMLLEEEGLLDKTVLISRCGHEDEQIVYDLSVLEGQKVSYFTTMIVKKSGVMQK